LSIPKEFLLPYSKDTVKIYHEVGNYDSRTSQSKRNIKSTHIYTDVVNRLKSEGYNVELVFIKDVPSRDVRFYQAQCDIFADMLTFGFFGANIREGMMLGKPCVCYIRPEWREQMRAEIPEYERELPVVSATPDTVYDVLKELVLSEQKRKEIGAKSREFAMRWHSAMAGAKRFDQIYSELLRN
ncbi:MAG: glycosyltransferase family 1 protein, partial [Bdellovibrionota bacterium]